MNAPVRQPANAPAPPARSGPARGDALPEDGGVRPITARRDVAWAAMASITLIAVFGGISTLLRSDVDDTVRTLSLVFSAACALIGGFITVMIDHRWFMQLRRQMTYMTIGGIVIAGLTVLSYYDAGLSTPFFIEIVLIASYLGLVLSTSWGRVPIVLILAVCGFLMVTHPEAALIDKVALPLIALAAWLLGRLGHLTHGSTARAAVVLSRSDPLTGTLNRRGFFEELDHAVAQAPLTGQELSLLLLDLDGFKLVNDRDGHAAGDDILRWVGARLAWLLPPDASAGRLGGDEFAVMLPATAHHDARALAEAIRRALASRIGTSIGVVTTTQLALPADSDTLMREADRLMYAEKRGVAAEPDDPVMVTREPTSTPAALPPPAPVTYAQLRARRRRQRTRISLAEFRWLFPLGYLVIAICGGAIALVQLSYGGNGFWDGVLRWGVVPWVTANIAAGVATVIWRQRDSTGRFRRIGFHAAGLLVGIGVLAAMLAGENAGIASPIMSALILKVVFDAYAMRTSDARRTLIVIMFFWLLTVILGPADARWLAPFHVALFLSAHAVGLVARRAYTDVTQRMLQLANADVLTGLSNRAGHVQEVDRAIAHSRSSGTPLALIALDLDDFKAINDTLGHEAGDEVLRRVALAARTTFPDAVSIARIGGDEFAAAVPFDDANEVAARCDALIEVLQPIVGASVGWAILGADGHERSVLMRVADARSYEAKRARRQSTGDTPTAAGQPG